MKLKMKGHTFIDVFFSLIILMPAFSCNHNSPNQSGKIDIKKINYLTPQKPGSSFTDSIIIDSPSAVFYNPDSLQLKKIKAITDTGVFKSTMHEFFYQQRNAQNVLKKYYPGIKITETKNARYIIFKIARGAAKKIDLDLNNDACGLFIFDGHKLPELVDMTNIDSQLGFYFSK